MIAPLVYAISHILYINPCLPNGCDIKPGYDSVQDRASSIATAFAHISPLDGPARYAPMVACVRATLAPFDIQVVTEDPGLAPHFETIFAGTNGELDASIDGGPAGVAPIVECGGTVDNVISFVFGNSSYGLNDPFNFLCAAIAQEAAHVWGLSHELDPDDPMTYLNLTGTKRFQNKEVACGESLASPHACSCGGTTQNSFTYLRGLFGLAPDLAPSTLRLARPAAGAHVDDAFPITASYESPVSAQGVEAKVDGVSLGTLEDPQYIWTGPTGLGLGAHHVDVTVLDAAERTVTTSTTVHVVPACDAGGCPDGGLCLGGACYGGPAVAGGLGSTCAEKTECSSNVCGQIADDSLCTAACDADRACPDGFECRGSDAGVCWPTAEAEAPTDDGGCSTGGSSAGLLLGILGVLGLASRRRGVPRSRS